VVCDEAFDEVIYQIFYVNSVMMSVLYVFSAIYNILTCGKKRYGREGNKTDNLHFQIKILTQEIILIFSL
jgi:hypothetical protein